MERYTYVDRDTCISCAACGAIAPNLFKYDEMGIAYFSLDNNVGNTAIANEELENLEDALEGCPTESIKVSNSSFNMPSLEEE
ncbi:ferredoxin [Staphylococcus epidermidis]|nr:ferredoxin [Staphylococcus epidermidis]MCG1795575.1 ferredoxin [Staphylococcus epidermidis]